MSFSPQMVWSETEAEVCYYLYAMTSANCRLRSHGFLSRKEPWNSSTLGPGQQQLCDSDSLLRLETVIGPLVKC